MICACCSRVAGAQAPCAEGPEVVDGWYGRREGWRADRKESLYVNSVWRVRNPE